MDFLKPPPWLHDLLPQGAARDFADQGGWLLVLGGAALLVLLVLVFLVGRLLRRRPAAADPEGGLREDLAGYPPAPANPGPRRLLVEGYPARVRLVVIAPVGKQAHIEGVHAEPLLEHVLRGLGGVAQHDRPRVRAWPAQLSHQGFAVKFHRLTVKPEPDGRPSHWALLAGRAKVGQHFILLGLAVWTDEPTALGRLSLEPDQWLTVLRVQAPGS
jgi:hypothetical protein